MGLQLVAKPMAQPVDGHSFAAEILRFGPVAVAPSLVAPSEIYLLDPATLLSTILRAWRTSLARMLPRVIGCDRDILFNSAQ